MKNLENLKKIRTDRKWMRLWLKIIAHFFDKALSGLYSLIYTMFILQAKLLSAGWMVKIKQNQKTGLLKKTLDGKILQKTF